LERDRPEYQRTRRMVLLPVRNSGAVCTVCHLGMHRKQRGSILEGQGGLALIVEHRLPPPAMRRKPLPVQLGLWNPRTLYRQLELWEPCYRRP
jgi:hypothetical protein